MTKKQKEAYRTYHDGNVCRVCPLCKSDTVPVLILFSTSKRQNGLYWSCRTPSCHWQIRFKPNTVLEIVRGPDD